MLRNTLLGLLLLSSSLLTAQSLVSLTPQETISRVSLSTTLPGLGIAYGAELYKMTYTTTDAFGQLDTASGLFVLPLLEPGQSFTSLPTAVYNHGTVDNREAVPSRQGVGERLLPTAIAGFGYAVLAPDYLGLGDSRGFHPYVHAETEARAGLDMLRALREYAGSVNLALNEQLFLTGYSQGGHASMALHQAIETELAGEFTVTAAAHLSGPYSISEAMVERIIQDEPYFSPSFLIYTFLSYNYVNQFYSSLDAVIKPQYVPLVEDFVAENLTLGALNDTLITLLVAEFDSSLARFLLQDSIVNILEQPEQFSDHPFWQALRENDVYEWAPTAPTRLVYCSGDEQVAFSNALLADSVMNALGALDVESINILPGASHGGCVFPAALFTINFFNQFRDVAVPVAERAATDPVSVFPNPARNGIVPLTGLDRGDLDAHLFDATGRLVNRYRLPEGERRLSLANLPRGIYWLRLSSGERMYTEKILIGQ